MLNFPDPPIIVGTIFKGYAWDGEKWTTNFTEDVASPSADYPFMDSVAHPGSSIKYSRGDHIHPSDTSRAPLASPTLTGDPRAPTPAGSSNTTSIATTAFVKASLAVPSSASPTALGTATPGTSLEYSRGDHRHPTDATRTPEAPTDGAIYARKGQDASWVKALPVANPDLIGNLYVSGSIVISRDANWTYINNSNASYTSLYLGGGTYKQNLYRNTTHYIQNAGGTENWLTVDASGITLGVQGYAHATPGASDNTKKIATTAFVQSVVASVVTTKDTVGIFDFLNRATFVNGSFDVGGTGTGTDCSAALVAASAGGAGQRVIFPPGNYRVGSSLDFTGSMIFEFQPGAVLCPDVGITITIRNPVIAGICRCFGDNGQVHGIRDVRPEWFGAKPDYATNCIDALDKAYACVYNSNGSVGDKPTIRFSRGGYYINRQWTVTSSNLCGLRILGAGPYGGDGTRIRGTTIHQNVIQVFGVPDDGIGGNSTSFEMRDIWVQGTDATPPNGTCLKFNNSGDSNVFSGTVESTIENCFFTGAYFCVLAYRLIQMIFRRCEFESGNVTGGAVGVQLSGENDGLGANKFGCDSVRFENCHWRGKNNASVVGVVLDSSSNISAIQFDTCEWLNHSRPAYLFSGNGVCPGGGPWQMGDIWFKACQFDEAHYRPIEMATAGTGVITDVHILDCFASAVGASAPSGQGYFVSGIAATQNMINSIFIHGNWIAGCAGRAVQIYNCSTWSVQNNCFTGVNSDYGIYLSDCYYCIIAGNIFGQGGQLWPNGNFVHAVKLENAGSGNQVHHNCAANRNSSTPASDSTGGSNQVLYNI